MQTLFPWRSPFRMIDALVACTPRERIVTEKRVSAGDPLAGGDGDGPAAFPAVLLLEGMGQSAALLFRLSRPDAAEAALPLLGWLEASLHGSAIAGESVRFEVRALKMTAQGGVFEAEARVGSALLAEARLAFSTRGSGDGAATTEASACD
jgi:3-hydroxyacyl-[acyl-carrier-protein] dehydratase